MNIGITYDLKEDYLKAGFSHDEAAEFDSIVTIDAIDSNLVALGHKTVRIGHVKNLIARLARGETWDLVFNIAEGMYGFSRESVIPAILEAYCIPCTFSDSLVLGVSLHKAMTKQIIRDLGLPTPDFFLVSAPEDIDLVKLPYPLFAKPVSEGTGKGVNARSKIRDFAELKLVCEQLLAQYKQPVLVETFLPGREVTVGITGTGKEAVAVGVIEVILGSKAEQDVYSYSNKEHYKDRVTYQLISGDLDAEAKTLALNVWKGLGCRDAGRIDLRADTNGKLSFIEINPLAGLHPEHSDLPIICNLNNIGYAELIRRIMHSALKRVKPL